MNTKFKIIIGILMLFMIFTIKPSTVKAEDMKQENGVITYSAHATNFHATGWHWTTTGWTFTVTQTINSTPTTKVVDLSYSTGFLKNDVNDGKGGITTYYTLSVDTLGNACGLDLKKGAISVWASAIVQIHYISPPNTSADYNSHDNIKSSTDPSWDLVNKYKTNYELYDRPVYWNSYYLTVKAGKGVASTYGSGWYPLNTPVNYGGTCATGYNSATSGTYTIGNKTNSVEVTATPNKLTIIYHANGGVDSDGNKNVIGKTEWNYETADNDLKNFSKFGLNRDYYQRKDNKEWNTNANGSGTSFNQDKNYSMLTYAPGLKNGNVELDVYAQWNANKLTIKYDKNGGSISANPERAISSYVNSWNSETDKKTLANFGPFGLYKTGWHKNDGKEWYTTDGGNTNGTYFNQDTLYSMAQFAPSLKNGNVTMTVHAQWVANNYTVTYKGNGNTSGSTANSSHTYDKASALSIKGFLREYKVTFDYNHDSVANTSAISSYKFTKWYLGDSGLGLNGTATTGLYDSGATVSNLTTTNDATLTMFATWENTNAEAKVTLPYPTRSGYNFNGWHNTKYADNTAYKNGTLIGSGISPKFSTLFRKEKMK